MSPTSAASVFRPVEIFGDRKESPAAAPPRNNKASQLLRDFQSDNPVFHDVEVGHQLRSPSCSTNTGRTARKSSSHYRTRPRSSAHSTASSSISSSSGVYTAHESPVKKATPLSRNKPNQRIAKRVEKLYPPVVVSPEQTNTTHNLRQQHDYLDSDEKQQPRERQQLPYDNRRVQRLFVTSPATTTDTAEEGSSTTSTGFITTKDLFHKAYRYINPGPLFRFFTYLYTERKLFVLFFAHAVATLVIWTHFAIIKFQEQQQKVPAGAPFYWWKRLAPPLEFGSMHAILFQMALIPLTMSRFSIAALADSSISRFVPLHRMVRMHIHLGYVMILIVFLATVFFFAFFGLLCANGEDDFCLKFTSEIMCTGYGILACLLIIGGTSYFRHSIPYEIFYAVHHLVFAMYAITIAHTFDNVQRDNERSRSQTFKWFSSTLLYYLCDRAAMHLNHRYRTRVVSSSAIHNTGSGSRMLFIKLRRPALLRFKPGQYAFLKLSKLDAHWHPFSIASSPSSLHLEFYIEVFGDNSWTGKLWKHLQGDGEGGFVDRQVEMEIMGPYGTSLAKTDDYSHVLAIGAGTGIVPILSLYKQHVRQLLRIEPEAHFKQLEEHQQRMFRVELADEARKGSMVKQLSGAFCARDHSMDHADLVLSQFPAGGSGSPLTKSDQEQERIRSHVTRCSDYKPSKGWKELRRSHRELKRAAFAATKSIYGVVALAVLTVLGVLLLSLTISWNTIPIDNLPRSMVEILKALTISFQIYFCLVALFVWDGRHFLAFIDTALCAISPAVDLYWFREYDSRGTLTTPQVVLFSMLIGYMTVRVWAMTVRPRHRSWRSGSHDSEGCTPTLERLEVVWVCRSASLISEILPDIQDVFEELIRSWGRENALQACRLSIHCTDKDPKAQKALKKEVSQSLSQHDLVSFGRPDLGDVIEDHTLDLIAHRRNSYSLLTFCGSPQLAQLLHQCKISNDMVTAITGHKKHQMEFSASAYGGVKPKNKNKTTKDDWMRQPTSEQQPQRSNDSAGAVESLRRTTSFLRDHSD